MIGKETARFFGPNIRTLSRSDVARVGDGPTYDEQYRRLLDLIDPASSFERAFLDYFYKNGLRLPDHAQHTPADGIPVQPDFYYERDGIPGICVFIDGPHHDRPEQAERDRVVRETLRDQGFRVVAINQAGRLRSRWPKAWTYFKGSERVAVDGGRLALGQKIMFS